MFYTFEDCLKYFKDNILNIIIENKLFILEINNISTYELHKPLSIFEINYFYEGDLTIKRLLYQFLENDKYSYNGFYISKYVILLFKEQLSKLKDRNNIDLQDKIIDNIINELKDGYSHLFNDKAYFFKSCREFQTKYYNKSISRPISSTKYEIKYKVFNGPEKTIILKNKVLDEFLFLKKINDYTLSKYNRSSIILSINEIKFDFVYNYLIDKNNNYIYNYY